MKITEIVVRLSNNKNFIIDTNVNLDIIYEQIFENRFCIDWNKYYLNAPSANDIRLKTIRDFMTRFIIRKSPEIGLNILTGDNSVHLSLRNSDTELYRDYITVYVIDDNNVESTLSLVDFIRIIEMSYEAKRHKDGKEYDTENATIHITCKTNSNEKVSISVGEKL